MLHGYQLLPISNWFTFVLLNVINKLWVKFVSHLGYLPCSLMVDSHLQFHYNIAQSTVIADCKAGCLLLRESVGSVRDS